MTSSWEEALGLVGKEGKEAGEGGAAGSVEEQLAELVQEEVRMVDRTLQKLAKVGRGAGRLANGLPAWGGSRWSWPHLLPVCLPSHAGSIHRSSVAHTCV